MNTIKTIATIMVVMIHVIAPILYRNINFLGKKFILVDIIDSLCRVAVPLFLFASGRYLIGKDEPLKVFYKKRIKRIGPAIIVFTIIYTILDYYIFKNFNRVMDDLIKGRVYYNMWYVYMIINIYLLTPLLWKIRNKGKKYLNIVAGISLIIGIIQSFLNIEVLWCFQFIYYLGYYILGYILIDSNIGRKNKNAYLFIYFISSFITSYLTFKFSFPNSRNLPFFNYLSPFVIVASICIYIYFIRSDFKANKFINYISKKSFKIYLIHPLILYIIDKNLIINNIFLNIIVRFLLCFGISILI